MTKSNLHALAAQNQSGYETADRQIEATLAVAYEQRTANLIAVYADGGAGLSTSEWSTVLKEIKERLEL